LQPALQTATRIFKTTWEVETDYYMDLGFQPENMQYFAISGRTAWYGEKGDQNAPLPGLGVSRFSTVTAVEFNGEPIRLTAASSVRVQRVYFPVLADEFSEAPRGF
jgi:hypothetical protein